MTASDNNYYFNPWEALVIHDQSTGGVAYNLAQWQAWSAQDGSSSTHWYTLGAADLPRSQIFINDTAATEGVNLGVARPVDLHGSVGAGRHGGRCVEAGHVVFS